MLSRHPAITAKAKRVNEVRLILTIHSNATVDVDEENKQPPNSSSKTRQKRFMLMVIPFGRNRERHIAIALIPFASCLAATQTSFRHFSCQILQTAGLKTLY